jgi:hypothetical protein
MHRSSVAGQSSTDHRLGIADRLSKLLEENHLDWREDRMNRTRRGALIGLLVAVLVSALVLFTKSREAGVKIEGLSIKQQSLVPIAAFTANGDVAKLSPLAFVSLPHATCQQNRETARDLQP